MCDIISSRQGRGKMFRVVTCVEVVGKLCVNLSESNIARRGFASTLRTSKTNFTTLRRDPHNAFKPSRNFKVNTQIIIRDFHTSPRRNLPPWVALYLVKPALKVVAALGGRASRKHWKGLSTKQKILYPSIILAVLSSALTLYYYTHIQETPITKRKRFVCITGEQLEKIVQFEAELLKESYEGRILPATHPYYTALLIVARQLLKANQDLPQLRDIKWSIAVVEDDAINAMVLPTGDVFFTTGLMNFVDNIDQLAVVFGHEMSHALLLHSAENLSLGTLVDYAMIVILAMLWCIIPSDGIAIITQWYFKKVSEIMIHLPYSRQIEEEADKVGLYLMAKACFDVREGSVFWRKMWMNKNASELTVGKNKETAFLSTHPPHEKRVKLNDVLIPECTKLREQHKCPPLPTIDPREQIKKKQKAIDDLIIAHKAGQDLRQVRMVTKR